MTTSLNEAVFEVYEVLRLRENKEIIRKLRKLREHPLLPFQRIARMLSCEYGRRLLRFTPALLGAMTTSGTRFMLTTALTIMLLSMTGPP